MSFGHPCISTCVVLLTFGVGIAVKLDDNLSDRTPKVRYVRTNRMLTTKLESPLFSIAKPRPQCSFSIVHLLSQIAGEVALVGIISHGVLFNAAPERSPPHPNPLPESSFSSSAVTFVGEREPNYVRNFLSFFMAKRVAPKTLGATRPHITQYTGPRPKDAGLPAGTLSGPRLRSSSFCLRRRSS